MILTILFLLLLFAAAWKFKFVPFGMAALTDDRDTPEREGKKFYFPLAAAVKVYQGGLAVLDSSGNCKKGVTATGLIAAGRFEETVDNSAGAAADLSVHVKSGTFKFANSAGGDEITKAQIGDACFIVDDQTVAKTNGTGTRSIAGKIIDVESDGVWVEVGTTLSLDGDLVAANNLGDVADPATARANIGANKLVQEVHVTNLKGADAKVYRVVAPVAGTIKKFWSVIDAALATGNATLTGSIGGVAITTGVITITQAGSAAGDVDSCVPTAANVVAAGDVIELTVGGTNDSATPTAKVSIEIEY